MPTDHVYMAIIALRMQRDGHVSLEGMGGADVAKEAHHRTSSFESLGLGSECNNLSEDIDYPNERLYGTTDSFF